MLLKVAKTLALFAVAVILLHGLPGICEETFAVASPSGLTSSDGCLSGDSCCAGNSFLQSASDLSLGALIIEESVPPLHVYMPQFTSSVIDLHEAYHPPRDITKLGKLTI